MTKKQDLIDLVTYRVCALLPRMSTYTREQLVYLVNGLTVKELGALDDVLEALIEELRQ